MGVSVGPGRGSAAGSAVAYCTAITNIDPIKYDLLFERFLNPDRVSLPDIDIDFDDHGRQKVIDYVIKNMAPIRWRKLQHTEPWQLNPLFEIQLELWNCH